MLVMTCRVGGSLRIGEDIRMALQGRIGSRVTIELQLTARDPVYLDGACLQPSVLPGDVHSHLISLAGMRRFTVGAFEVGVWLPDVDVPETTTCDDFIHIGVTGPGPLRVGYQQDRAELPWVYCLPPATARLVH
ncbi:MAG: hypothetical protein KF800_13645 [Lysobacter sp.]|nr:hypothetical protein [Lysobacter sp.]